MNKFLKEKLFTPVKSAIVTGSGLIAGATAAMADGTGNTGADAIITTITGLIPVAAAVIGAAVLVVVVPWGAKMAIGAFKSIGGGH